MGTIIYYIFLSILTIAGIVGATNGFYWMLVIMAFVWTYVIYGKIKQEQRNRFKDWEMKKYNYNAVSQKEQKEHYNEYKNERKNNKSVK